LSLSGFSLTGLNVSWNGGSFLPYSNYNISPGTDTIIPVVVINPLQPACVPSTNYFTINVNPLPVATLSINPVNDTICQGATATFSVSPPGYSDYSFYNGATLLQSSNSPNYIPTVPPGNFSINVTTTYLGCQYETNPLPLTILPAPPVTLSASAGSGSLCFEDTVTFTATPAGYPNYTFYNGSTILQSNSSNILINSSFSGIGNSISVVASNTEGCNSASSNTFNYNVLPPTLPILSCSDVDKIICTGDPVTFTATPAGMSLYEFFDGTTLLQSSASNSYTSSELLPGNSFSVTGTDVAGCKSLLSNTLIITVKPRPNSFISASDTTICSGTSVTLNAGQMPVISGTTFSWSTGSVAATVSYSPTNNTSYVLNSSLNGCVGIPDTLLILVDNNPPPLVNASGSTTICPGDSATLSGIGGSNMFWTPATGLNNNTISNPHASPGATTTYTLNTYNLYCISQASVTVTIDLCLTDIPGPIPTCITPNADGANDYFIIPNVDYFQKNSIVIYNRWGNVIYKDAPYKNDWDGKSINGTELPDALYYYVLDLGNGNKPHTGYVLIHR
jgi:gliding motility-associated-like protein